VSVGCGWQPAATIASVKPTHANEIRAAITRLLYDFL
jgi:hypothetical protein